MCAAFVQENKDFPSGDGLASLCTMGTIGSGAQRGALPERPEASPFRS
jgi:hypothetical protein